VMLQIKHELDCDWRGSGFRWHKTARGNVGSFVLGGRLMNLGALSNLCLCCDFHTPRRSVASLAEISLQPYRREALVNHPLCSVFVPIPTRCFATHFLCFPEASVWPCQIPFLLSSSVLCSSFFSVFPILQCPVIDARYDWGSLFALYASPGCARHFHP